VHAAAKHAAKPAGLPAATVKLHGPLPTQSKLYKDALSREGKAKLNSSVKDSHESAKDHKEALAKAHAATAKKAAARKAKQQESVSQEKKLVAFLDSAGGSAVKTFKAPKTVTLADRAKKEVYVCTYECVYI
jgi:cell envelope opacity-associated protein A